MKGLRIEKKIVAIMLVAAMVLSLNISAYAATWSINSTGVQKTTDLPKDKVDMAIASLQLAANNGAKCSDVVLEFDNLSKMRSFYYSLLPLMLFDTNTNLGYYENGGGGPFSKYQIKLSFTDSANPAELMAKYNDMKAKINAIVAAAPEDYTAKLSYFADYICDNTTYDHNEGANRYYVDGFFNDGAVVCQGYAYLFYTLCYYAGIECCNASCTTSDGAPHMFSAVKVDGVWKEIDVCWMDGDDSHRFYEFFLKDLSEEWQNQLNQDTYYITDYVQ